jgi:D-alanine-D-alanine ligase
MLMNNLKIAIFHADENNSDHACTISDVLRNLGCQTENFVFTNVTDCIANLEAYRPDLIFNSFSGSDQDLDIQMHLVCVIELMSIPYIGHAPFTLGLTGMKNFVKRLLESKKIPSIPYQIYREVPNSTYLEYPLMIRPANMDWLTARLKKGPIGDPDQLKAEVSACLKQYQRPVLVESFLQGRVYLIGVFGNREPKILPVCEVVCEGQNWLYRCPAEMHWELSYHLRDIALHVYKYLMGKDFALISFLISNHNHVYVTDYHPNPSLAKEEAFQKALSVSQYDFKDVISQIIDENLKRVSYVENKND